MSQYCCVEKKEDLFAPIFELKTAVSEDFCKYIYFQITNLDSIFISYNSYFIKEIDLFVTFLSYRQKTVFDPSFCIWFRKLTSVTSNDLR